MKLGTHDLALTIIFSFFAGTCFSEEQPPAFNCLDVSLIVDYVEEGPDTVINDFFLDPEFFVYSSVDGWDCYPEPFPRQRGRTNYLKSVDCFYKEQKPFDKNQDLARAGNFFKNQLPELFECFDGELLSLSMKSYFDTTTGEVVVIVLDRVVSRTSTGKKFLLLEYGYSSDRGSNLMWITSIGYSRAGPE